MKSIFSHNIIFCPHCGVQAIRRLIDTKYAVKRNNARGPEYVCDLCGFSFRITKSSLVMIADELFKESRQCRTSKDECLERVLAPDVVQAFKDMGERMPPIR